MKDNLEVNVPRGEELKVYKEKPYLNSNKKPFGLTIKGKTKEYIDAHEYIKGLIVKGKVVQTNAGKMKVLDASRNKAMLNAMVEVGTSDSLNRGNIELKVHNASLDKKKGATLEIRKISDSEYFHVEKLRDIIVCLLDNFLNDKDLNGGNSDCVGVSKEKIFYKCNVCDWQTRFEPALKGHMKRMHKKGESGAVSLDKYSCDKCEFESTSKVTLTAHTKMNHKKETRKREKATVTCEHENCGSTFDSGSKLN